MRLGVFSWIWAVCISVSLLSYHYSEEEIGHSFYYPEIDLIYYYSPKTGSSFIREALNHPFSKEKKEVIDQLKGSCVSLFVIRHPLYRAISCYEEVLKARKDCSPDTIHQPFYKNRDNVRNSFLQYLNTIKGGFYDYHTLPQKASLDYRGMHLEDMDFIIDFDSLEEDLKVFSSRYKIPIQVGDLYRNEGNSEKKRILREYIDSTPEIVALIEEIYEQDFILYEKAMQKRAHWILENTIKIKTAKVYEK